MTIIAAIALLGAVVFCMWMCYMYMVDIFEGHGQAHSYVFGIGLGLLGGYMFSALIDIVSAWF